MGHLRGNIHIHYGVQDLWSVWCVAILCGGRGGEAAVEGDQGRLAVIHGTGSLETGKLETVNKKHKIPWHTIYSTHRIHTLKIPNMCVSYLIW